MFQSAGRSSEEGATSEGCKGTGSGLFPVDAAERRCCNTRLPDPMWGHPRAAPRQDQAQLPALRARGPRHASVGEGRGREREFSAPVPVRKQGKEEAVAQSGPGVRLGEQRGRESTSSRDSANPLKSAAGAEPQYLWIRRFLKASPALQDHKCYLAAPRTLHCKQMPGLLWPREI